MCTLAFSVLLSLKLKFVKVTKHPTRVLFCYYYLLLFSPSFLPLCYVGVEGKESVDIIRFLLT